MRFHFGDDPCTCSIPRSRLSISDLLTALNQIKPKMQLRRLSAGVDADEVDIKVAGVEGVSQPWRGLGSGQ
jgi:hypothetical protein